MANHRKFWTLLIPLVPLSACTQSPGIDQINAWQQEAIAENNRLLKTYAKPSDQLQWHVMLQGQVQKPQRLNWQSLTQLSKTQITTKDSTLVNPEHPSRYRGIAVSTLLDQSKAQSDTITFVAADAYRATVARQDLQKYPILLAIEREDKPMTRADGGPVKLVFPISQYPELEKYNGTAWVFYVTHVIAGTEAPQVQVGKTLLLKKDLDRLPSTTITTPVSYRVGWQNGPVRLEGIRIRDLLPELPKTGWVTIRGKAPIHRDPQKPLRLPVNVVRNCDVIIARRWGDQATPISAPMGGPLTLAFAPACGAIAKTFPWITFVESLEISPP